MVAFALSLPDGSGGFGRAHLVDDRKIWGMIRTTYAGRIVTLTVQAPSLSPYAPLGWSALGGSQSL